MAFKSKFLQEAEKRGFIFQCTNYDKLDEMLNSGRPLTAYWGTDPTGASLHVGHIFSLMVMRLFQKYGNKPIVLVGGGTVMIGDPSGKDRTRPMLTREKIEENSVGIRKSIAKFIKIDNSSSGAIMVDNYDWWKLKGYIEILREVGLHISVNRMLTFESVKQRLAKETHMSFLEFNYMILQAYDFYYLFKKYNCEIQLCGADQWGNVVAGVELVRRLEFENGEVEQGESREVFGLSTPLLTDANGKKIGKSEGNAIWVNEDMLDPFQYFQYFRNVDDKDVVRFLKMYTDLEVEQIDSMANDDINNLKKILAFETTKICHGEKVANECLEKATKIYEHKSFEDLEKIEYKNIGDKQPQLAFLMKELNIVESMGEARRLIRGGAVKINDKKIDDENYVLAEDLKDFKLSIGKKKFLRVVIVK